MEEEACQLKVTLRGTRPPIWRRLLVPADTTVTRMHRVLQIAMGWQDGHMHEFRVDRRHPAIRSSRVGDVLTEIGSSLTYTYDLGDGWEHSIVLEKRYAGDGDAGQKRASSGPKLQLVSTTFKWTLRRWD